MEYKRNQNSYEELQTIVEAHLETIEKLRTKLHKFRVLELDEELFKEAVASLGSKAGEETTETFKLPTKWKVKDCKEVSEYAHKRFNCSDTVGDNTLHVNEATNYYRFLKEEEDYQEITLEQFLQFVYRPFLASESGAEKTEFKLDQNEIYSLEGTTKEQREKLLTWLKANDIGWEEYDRVPYERLKWSVYENQWVAANFLSAPTRYIKDLI